jgi:23S rRNA U2552 (ribose-2'-O)-methylase RlmE/FtsJ
VDDTGAYSNGPDYVPRYLMKSKRTPIKSFHLAEGPGGFIEALAHLRKNSEDTYVGMTILDNNPDTDDYNIPGWKKSQQFLKENPNVFIENGVDGTGNILNLANFVYCKEKYASSMDLITADGGFDFSNDFNNQEISIANLLFAQVAFALCIQKKNGSFVLKVFDCFMPHTIDLFYILSSFYEKVYITKPQTSRYANSEKYIVCKKFSFSSCDEFYPVLYEAFAKMCDVESSNRFIHRFLNIPISNYFLSRLEEYNSIFGQQQIENIYYTISLIETKNKAEKIDMLIKSNIQKCIHWCMKYDIPHHVITSNTNIFLNSSSFL